MISLDKKNLPRYLFKLNVALVAFFIAWFVLGVPLMVTVGCIYDESVITYAVMGSTFALFFIGLAIFWLLDVKLNKRFIRQRAAELEKEFCDMPFEEAERVLKERGIITDKGFIVKGDGVFGGETVVPFEDTVFDLLFFQLVQRVNMDIVLYKYDGDRFGSFPLDCVTYNFLKNKDTDIKENEIFNLLVSDKKEFAEFALKRQKILQWDFSGYGYR